MKKRHDSWTVATFAVVLVAGSLFVANSASAQGYGRGLYHHSELGYRGASGHFNYGDLRANQTQMHSGTYSSGYRGYTQTMPRLQQVRNRVGSRVGYHSMTYTGPIGADGHPSGVLRPGMVLPDGAVVVSVGP